jgi:quercetin dioxygenase-like cupin family protein
VRAALGRPHRDHPPERRLTFEPGEKHWHGASPETAMSHIAIQEARNGSPLEWMEKVTDEQYGDPASKGEPR